MEIVLKNGDSERFYRQVDSLNNGLRPGTGCSAERRPILRQKGIWFRPLNGGGQSDCSRTTDRKRSASQLVTSDYCSRQRRRLDVRSCYRLSVM